MNKNQDFQLFFDRFPGFCGFDGFFLCIANIEFADFL